VAVGVCKHEIFTSIWYDTLSRLKIPSLERSTHMKRGRELARRAGGAIARSGRSAFGHAKGAAKSETVQDILIELSGNALVTVATRKAMQARPDMPPVDLAATGVSILAMAFTKGKTRRFARAFFRASSNAAVARIAGAASSFKVTQGPDGHVSVDVG
jgi:hypothetical protein